jgi:asparagine synthase (glutamine-hydrolysing)
MPAQYGYMGIFYKADIFLSAYRKPKHLKNRYWAGVFTPNEISELLINPDSQSHERIGPLKKNSDDQSIDDLGLEYQTSYLPDVICAHTDKASMLHSIEARSPFLDNAVIDVALKIPAKYKLYQGFGKYILRKLLHKRLPQSKVPWLKKHGYTVPMASILRTDLKAYMLEALSSASLNNIGIFRSEPIELLINDHISGKRNNHKKLWTLIVFVTWYRNNIIINKS